MLSTIVQGALHKADTTTEWLANQQLTHQISKSAHFGHDQWIIIVDTARSSCGKNCQGKSEVNKVEAASHGQEGNRTDLTNLIMKVVYIASQTKTTLIVAILYLF